MRRALLALGIALVSPLAALAAVVTPCSGPPAGGNTITIQAGYGLSGATRVDFGDTAGTILTKTDYQITATAPASTNIRTVSFVAGHGTPDFAASFNTPTFIVADGIGSVYLSDTGSHTIRKITEGRVVSTWSGSAGMTGTIEGLYSSPLGIAVDSGGNLYVADSGNHAIRKIGPNGAVSKLAGLAGTSGSSDGQGTAARFKNPAGVAIDSARNVFVADAGNRTIRKITPEGVVTTFAGSAGVSGSADGLGIAATFENPYGIAIDDSDNIYVTDASSYTIRKITPAAVVSTLAGLAGFRGTSDGPGDVARFYLPRGVVTDGAGNIYVADDATVRKITPAGDVTTIAGAPQAYGSSDGAALNARFTSIAGISIDSRRILRVTESTLHTVRSIAPAKSVDIVVHLSGGTITVPNGYRYYNPPAFRKWSDVTFNQQMRGLAANPSDGKTVWLGADGSKGVGIYRSTDRGMTWSCALPACTDAPEIYSIAVDPQNPWRIYAGGTLMSNDGSNWRAPSTPPATPVHALVVHPASSSIIYAGTDGSGIWSSTDYGVNWSWLWSSQRIRAIALNPADSNLMLGADSLYGDDGGIYQSNGGTYWTLRLRTPRINSIAIDPLATHRAYAATDGSGIYRSDDSGVSWIAKSQGLPNANATGINDLNLDANDPNVVYAGLQSYGVYRSTDCGETWTEFNSDAPGGGTGPLTSSSILRLASLRNDTSGPLELVRGVLIGTLAGGGVSRAEMLGAPEITSISPNRGTMNTPVRIAGANFEGVANVSFGTSALSPAPVQASTRLTATVPYQSPGPLDVTVETSAGTATLTGGFTYYDTPRITTMTPSAGTLSGGNVTIGGINLQDASSVTFGTKSVAISNNSATSITVTAPAQTSAGAVDVAVTTPGGTSHSSYTYYAEPTLTAIGPTAGPIGGGTTITLTGTNFVAPVTVTFGGAAVSSTIVHSMSIVITAPAHAPGPVTITVSNPGGASAAKTYTYMNTPTLTAVSPVAGPITAGTTVTLTGTNFAAATVWFGGVLGTNVTIVSATSLTVNTPGQAAGSVDVTVRTPGGTATKPNAFTYMNAPTVASVTPSAGPLTATAVAVGGTNFVAGVTTVKFGATAAPSVTVNSSTSITATTPASAAAGSVTVAVTTPGGTGSLPNGYRYVAPPQLTSVTPSRDRVVGGASLTIAGNNLADVTAIYFGDVKITSLTKTATSITLTAPAHPAEATIWTSAANIDEFTGDGHQTIDVSVARDSRALPVPSRDGRFTFDIVTAGTAAPSLQASGHPGRIDLAWTASPLDTLAGYNVYRSTANGGPYMRLNAALVDSTYYSDFSATPNATFYYVYRVVNTSLRESSNSNQASATATDSTPPAIVHTPLATAPANTTITIVANVVDNYVVTSASVNYRGVGAETPYTSAAMINATGSQYTANVPSAAAKAPGLEYYIEATDGTAITRHGTPEFPHVITIAAAATRGDANGDNVVNVLDVFYLINYMFAGGDSPLGACDMNSDEEVTPADIVALINLLFAAPE